MKFRFTQSLLAGVCAAGSVFIVSGAVLSTFAGTDETTPSGQPAKITVDYPLNGSVFPPEITPPTVLWHDPVEAAKRWVVEVSFGDRSNDFRVDAAGKPPEIGMVDPQAGPAPELTPEQASAHMWKPDAGMWAKIKRLSAKSPATITITGYADDARTPLSMGKVTIMTSADGVGAPVFYRDVPLMLPSPDEKGPISPLPLTAIPLIKWRVRNIAEPTSHVVMENMPTCANCHSFSRDGTTFGLDLDGPRNDKGLYALVPVAKNMTIRNQDVIHWSSFQSNSEASASQPAVKRFRVHVAGVA